MTERSFSIAIVGATGVVGQELIQVLDQRLFPVGDLRLYASARSAGDEASCGALNSRVGLLGQANFNDTDIIFFTAGEQVSAEWVARATEAGAVAIDSSQLFAGDEDVPLVVPEVNKTDIAEYAGRSLIVSPDPVSIALAIALKPIQLAAGITRVVATSFESVSGAGKAGIDQMQNQTLELLNGRDADIAVFPQRIAFNTLPQVGDLLAGGYSSQEENVRAALRRLLADDFAISVTRVRAPLFYGTTVSVSIETSQSLGANEARRILRESPGVLLFDEEENPRYSTPADVVGEDSVSVGRVRADESVNQLDLWLAIDNTRKGSSVNAVQIAEILVREYL